MAQDAPDGYEVITERVASQCGITPDQVLALLEPTVAKLSAAGVVQNRDITLEGVSHVLPLGNLESSTFCQDGFNRYVQVRLENETATEPRLAPLGRHHLVIAMTYNEVYPGDYPGATVSTDLGARCTPSVYYTDGTSPLPTAWDNALPRTQIMEGQPLHFMWHADSAAYGGDFVVVCSRHGQKYSGRAAFDILPIMWPRGQ